MTWIESIFSKKEKGGLQLKFSKQNDTWMVVKNHDILFMGGEAQCKTYISNFKDSQEENPDT